MTSVFLELNRKKNELKINKTSRSRQEKQFKNMHLFEIQLKLKVVFWKFIEKLFEEFANFLEEFCLKDYNLQLWICG